MHRAIKDTVSASATTTRSKKRNVRFFFFLAKDYSSNYEKKYDKDTIKHSGIALQTNGCANTNNIYTYE